MAIDTRGRKRRPKTERRELGRWRDSLAREAKAKRKAYNTAKKGGSN